MDWVGPIQEFEDDMWLCYIGRVHREKISHWPTFQANTLSIKVCIDTNYVGYIVDRKSSQGTACFWEEIRWDRRFSLNQKVFLHFPLTCATKINLSWKKKMKVKILRF